MTFDPPPPAWIAQWDQAYASYEWSLGFLVEHFIERRKTDAEQGICEEETACVFIAACEQYAHKSTLASLVGVAVLQYARNWPKGGET